MGCVMKKIIIFILSIFFVISAFAKLPKLADFSLDCSFTPSASKKYSPYYKEEDNMKGLKSAHNLKIEFIDQDVHFDGKETDCAYIKDMGEGHLEYYVNDLIPLNLYTDQERNTDWYKTILDEANFYLGKKISQFVCMYPERAEFIFVTEDGSAFIQSKKMGENFMPITFVGNCK